MKNISFVIWLGAALLIAACQPQPTTLPTNTPKPPTEISNSSTTTSNTAVPPTVAPTATTVPPTTTPAPAILNGMLFLDANGSGGFDAAVFQCPEANAQSPALEYYFGPVCASKAGQVVTITEPVLPGITVCYDTTCSTTGADGRFSMEIPISGNVSIRVSDPNTGNDALALRYTNIRIDEVTDEINGTLYETVLSAISHPIDTSTQKDNIIGLMQGPLTSPFRPGENRVLIWNGFDIDGTKPWIRDGKQANYLGFTKNGWPHSPYRSGVNDSHSADDYSLPVGTSVLAMAPSQFTYTGIENGVNLEYSLNGLRLSIQYGHLKENSFSYKPQTHFLRGQQIALSGDTGDVDPHFGIIAQLHVMVFDKLNSGKPQDPFRNTSGKTYEMGSEYSLWSVDNLMVDPIPGQLP